MGLSKMMMHLQEEYEKVEIRELEVSKSHAIPESEGGRERDWQTLVVLHCYQH